MTRLILLFDCGHWRAWPQTLEDVQARLRAQGAGELSLREVLVVVRGNAMAQGDRCERGCAPGRCVGVALDASDDAQLTQDGRIDRLYGTAP